MQISFLQKLRAKRKEIADREGKELYRVFTNATLEATAAAMPQTKTELLLIKGWGPKKVAAYGDEILELLRQSGEDTQLLDGFDKLTVSEAQGSSPVTNNRSPIAGSDVVFSVAEFLEAINITLLRLGTARVRGEISELEVRDRVVYFNLRDASGEASVRCILWRWKFDRDYSYLEDGLEIVVVGVAEVYAKYGSFSLRVEKVDPVGEGALRKAFEALKAKLTAKGYFDEERKRTIPPLVQKIGLITSEAGAAIQDFLTNLGAYGFEILFLDVRVEGDRAEESIIRAIRWLNMHGRDIDVLVLTRGGGGFESLKTFDSERVAEAILTSRIPIITGVGHEVDKTIAGYVADKDFSTPTAAALFLKNAREELLAFIGEAGGELTLWMDDLLGGERTRIHENVGNLVNAAERVFEREAFRLRSIVNNLAYGLSRVFERFRTLQSRFLNALRRYEHHEAVMLYKLEASSREMAQSLGARLTAYEHVVAVAEAALLPLNPEHILRRGYGVVYNLEGGVIKEANNVKIGERIDIRLYKGKIGSRIETVSGD